MQVSQSSSSEKTDSISSTRDLIVINYETGGKDDNNIEEAEFDIHYIHYDRYGFVHDLRVSENKRQSAFEKKWLDKEKTREEKWITMVTDVRRWFTVGDKSYHKMEERIWKGVPDKMRGTVWRILLNVDQVKLKQQGIFEEMKQLGRSSCDVVQIDLDIRRTFRRHVMFRERYSPGQADLFTVLSACSVYNKQVGYCQGMSSIAALLLMYINCDEDTFHAVNQLFSMKKINMKAFYLPSFPKLETFQILLEKILLTKLNKLHAHLKEQKTDPSIYSVRWFLQCFVDSLPFSLTLRVWDLFLLMGDTVLLAMAYNILKLHSKNLIKMDMDLLAEFFQKTLPSSFGFEDDFVIESLRESVEEVYSLQLDTTPQEKAAIAQNQNKVESSNNAKVPIVKVSQMEEQKPEEDSDDSGDEEITAADEADLTVIVEDVDENITIESNRSNCSSRDDCSSSVDFYEELVLIETDHINSPATDFGMNRHRLPLRDVVDKRDIEMFQMKLRLLFERKLDDKDRTKSKINFVKRVRIQNIETRDVPDLPQRLEADIIVEREM